MSDCADLIFSNVDKKTNKNERPVKLCNYTDVYYNEVISPNLNFMDATASKTEIERFTLKRGDVIITKDSETADDIAVPAYVKDNLNNVLCGYHLAIIRSNRAQLYGRFLSKLLQLQIYRHYFFTLANGVTRFGLTSESTRKAIIPLPPLPEQKKIAEILSAWDRAIEQTRKLIDARKRLKKGLMQQLLSGRVRFPEFGKPVTQKGELPDGWRVCKLGDCFRERSETNPDLQLLSITSDRGVILRDEVERKDTSNVDKGKYKRIAPGDIGYNTMRMWQGVSAVSNFEGIVSPAYTICQPRENHPSQFYRFLFKYPPIINLFFRFSQGLVSDTLNLKYHHFALIKVVVPLFEEQERIAETLSKIDTEIELHNQKVIMLIEQRKGLMQKLLSGEIRVNTSN